MTTAKEFATQIAVVMGCKIRRHGREYRTYCPVHEADGGEHNCSYAIWDKPAGGFASKCMTGCTRPQVTAALRAKGVLWPKAPALTPEEQAARAAAHEEERVAKLSRARELLEESAPIFYDDPVDRYLRSRALTALTENIRIVEDPLHPGSKAMLCP